MREELLRYGREAVVQACADLQEAGVRLSGDGPEARQTALVSPSEVYLRDGSLHHDVMVCDRDYIINHFMRDYGDRLRWWEPTGGSRAGSAD